MILFYSKEISGDEAILDEEESRHCAQVLRKRPGDNIHLIDGVGGFYRAVLDEVHRKKCTARILEQLPNNQARDFKVHLAIAPTKNMARIEWLLEKITEIGIDEISLVICRHSERTKVRLDRLEKILLSATKQSLKARLPVIHPLFSFKDFFEKLDIGKDGKKYIGYIDENVNEGIKDNYLPGKDVCILIGPEGGFSREEVDLAMKHGFQAVSLGKSRLRTETAGLVACHTIHLLNA
ncbi:MAG: ribosomal RNA small subunit methyltransferase E [Saprospiraceae bacterium]|nr:MAG: ribosomal RNA small subunit methyltransferase E [Saprospiraceae bacterium]